jgi:hypothetical protein
MNIYPIFIPAAGQAGVFLTLIVKVSSSGKTQLVQGEVALQMVHRVVNFRGD